MVQIEAQLYPHDKFMRPLVALVPRWITPNMVTVLRFIMTPITLYFLWRGIYGTGTILFFIAAFTDALDGSMARIRNQITKWGIFFDPVVDKLLIGTVMLIVAVQYIQWWIVALVIAMELAIIVGAAVRKKKGKLNQANIWGKLKMLTEFTALMLLLAGIQGHVPLIEFAEYSFLIALVFGGISYATYSP